MHFIRIIVATVVVLAASFFGTSSVSAQDRFAEIAVEYSTGEIIFGTNENELRHPASLTKIMTLYLLFEALEDGRVTLETQMPVSRNASRQPATRLGLARGSTISVNTAIDALIVLSANDVATVVAEYLGRTESNFALRMTRRAHGMGMESTVFANASGLPSTRQVTTASDMAILGRRLIEDYPQYYSRFSAQSFVYGRRTYRGHNRVMNNNSEVDGIKTGYTRASGFNLVSSAVRDGRRVITVVLGGATAVERDAQMVDLIHRAFDTPAPQNPYRVTQVGQQFLEGLPIPDVPSPQRPYSEPPVALGPVRVRP